MIANLFFWNKTIYQKAAGYLRGLAQLSISWRYSLSLDCQLIASAAWPPFRSPQYKPSYNSEYVHLTTLFLFPLGSLLHHISNYLLGTYLHRKCDLCLYLFNESLGLFSSRGWCPRWMLVFSIGQCRQHNRTMNQSILRNFHQFWILNLPNLWKQA